MKLGQNFCLEKSRTNMKMGHVRPKTRSLGQILEKPCVCSIDQIFGLILMKFVRVFASMKSCTFLKMGHVGSKTRSLSQIIEDHMVVIKVL